MPLGTNEKNILKVELEKSTYSNLEVEDITTKLNDRVEVMNPDSPGTLKIRHSITVFLDSLSVNELTSFLNDLSQRSVVSAESVSSFVIEEEIVDPAYSDVVYGSSISESLGLPVLNGSDVREVLDNK